MKNLILFLLTGVTLCLTGCFTLSKGKEPGMKNHIMVTNYGWYLFNSIPLTCGNASDNASFPFVIFRDDVKMDKLQHRLIREAKLQDRQVENLVWNNYNSVLFSIPFLNIPAPIPYIITYREKQLSGELK